MILDRTGHRVKQAPVCDRKTDEPGGEQARVRAEQEAKDQDQYVQLFRRGFHSGCSSYSMYLFVRGVNDLWTFAKNDSVSAVISLAPLT